MNPIISIGLYLASQVLLLSMANGSLGNAIGERVFHNRRWLKILIAVVYMLLALLPVAGALLPDSAVKFSLQAGGNIWLGFYIYFGGTFIILSFIWQIVIWLTHKKSATISTGILTVSILAGVILLCYGMIHAKKTVVKNYDITINKEADGLTDLHAVLLADLHLSVNSDLATIENMVRMVNAENPDVIVIAGDIFTSTYAGLRNPDEYAAALRELKAPYGVYAVYGNHDVEETLFGGFPISPIREAFRTKEMEQFFADCGFTILYDETVPIADGKVMLTGRVDGEKAGDGTANRMSPEEVLRGVDKTKPVIVLQHEPVEFAPLAENGADLVLCGHTHAGQIFPGNLIVPFFNENGYGYKNISGVDTVVTSGIGFYGPPMRVGTNSEITVVDVHFAS